MESVIQNRSRYSIAVACDNVFGTTTTAVAKAIDVFAVGTHMLIMLCKANKRRTDASPTFFEQSS